MQDMTAFVAAGSAAIINNWLIDGNDPLDPEDIADRLIGIAGVFAGRQPVRMPRARRVRKEKS
jgi:hypothetical protein